MDSGSIIFIVPLLVALAIAGVGYAFFGRKIASHDRSNKRLESVSKSPGERKSRKNAADPAQQRRRQVQDQLKELEAKQKSAKVKMTLRNRIEGAGLKMTPRGFYIASIVCGAAIGFVMLTLVKIPIVAVLAAFAGGLGLPRWVLNFLRERRQKAFVREFAPALEIITRGVKSGLPVNECLKIIANESPKPVGEEFVEVVEGQKMGVPLDQGLQKLYERMPIAEVNFFMIVLNIQQKTGGNLSEALGNLARVLRDRKKLRMKVQAMSSEAKASAMIIGALPFVVMAGMAITSPQYMEILLTEKIGNFLLLACGMWMGLGILVMAKMINFKI